MRLVEILSNRDFRLTPKLRDSAIPRYAILSHTWGDDDDEEVTYEDMLEGTGRHKAGYKKIEFCAQEATRDHLKYFWMDSCCIKKSSDAELTESLNSMFRWYQRAAKCYVYLVDVSTTEHHSRWNWEQVFRGSRWFTRGWTLLELLAPRTVVFFSRQGQQLGDREELKDLIEEITGIPIGALQGDPMSHFEIDERFSWARSRRTTREEDEAYSLLGIFEIYMPIIYGEGRQRAIYRLRKEIKQALNEESIRKMPQSHGSEEAALHLSMVEQKWAALQALEGHKSRVNAVAFSPDGKTLASGSDDNTIRLWDTRSGAALQTLEGHKDEVNAVAFSPDGKTLASGSNDNTVRLWNAQSGAILQMLEGHKDEVNAVAFSPDGKTLVSGSDDNTARLWDGPL